LLSKVAAHGIAAYAGAQGEGLRAAMGQPVRHAVVILRNLALSISKVTGVAFPNELSIGDDRLVGRSSCFGIDRVKA
jgi:hypothetical protein